MYRQLHRLEEEGIEVVRVPVDPDESFGERFIEEMDINTSIVMLSRVYFETSLLNDFLPEIASAARLMGIPVLIDDYHGTNVVPLSIRDESLEDCFFLIGGYKYLQWGEGNCFLRFPKDCEFRPAITGWFASFSTLEHPRTDAPVQYDDSDQRFATATYDPSSQFRAAKVVDFFEQQGLTPSVLRSQYEDQIGLLRSLFQEKDFDPKLIKVTHTEPISKNGGFLSLTSPHARTIKSDLLQRGIYTDARNNILRLGPAPYITESQIIQVVDELETSIKNNL